MADERTLNKQLASVLGGDEHVYYDHGYGRTGYVDVQVNARVFECSKQGRKDAIDDAEKRVKHGFGDVIAVWYDPGTERIDSRRTVNARRVAPPVARDWRGPAGNLR